MAVTVSALPGQDLAEALIFSPSLLENGSHKDAFPTTVEFNVPLAFAGSFDVMAVTRNSSGAVAEPLELSFPVVPSATLNGITIVPDLVTLETPGQPTSLRVAGHYSDGVDRDISNASAGTTYSTASPAVATVTAHGLVTAVADGQTTITVQNSGVVANVPVDVDHARFLKLAP